MYGTTGVVGLITPSCNTVVEAEFQASLPDGYTSIASRMWMQGGGEQGLANMADDADRACRELRTAHVDVAVFACTSASFMNGNAGEAQLRDRLREHAGCEVTTTSAAFIDALRHLGAERVAVASPYNDRLNQLEHEYLVANGFSVSGIRGMKIDRHPQSDPYPSGRAAHADVLEFVLGVPRDGADAIVISCTNFPGMQVMAEVEDRTGLPVVTSNQATIWSALRHLGFEGSIPGFGRLLQSGFRASRQSEAGANGGASV